MGWSKQLYLMMWKFEEIIIMKECKESAVHPHHKKEGTVFLCLGWKWNNEGFKRFSVGMKEDIFSLKE